jgi:hypothetical protein
MQEIWQPNEEGWFDVDLDISSATAEANRLAVIARGTFEGSAVGVKVNFREDMRHGILGGQVDHSAFASDGIEFVSLGQESDQLLNALAKLYSLPAQKRRFTERLAVVTLALEENLLNFENNHVHFKVFFNPKGGPEEYAELFVNLNLPARRLELHEKDAEYRRNVVAALSMSG